MIFGEYSSFLSPLVKRTTISVTLQLEIIRL